jgi:hypothetical protein
MFRAIVWMQWKSTRALSLLTTIIAFALPLASLQLGRSAASASGFVAAMQAFGAAYALLAALVGLLVALGAWRPDHSGRHVYALSLPVPRSRYAMFRFGAGLLFLVPTIAALLVGALLVSVSPIPEGLHAFPVALTLRFALASLVAYAIFFAIASSTNRTAGLIIAIFAGIIFSQYLLAVFADGERTVDVLGAVLDFVFVRPGILSVFAGRWMLIDA